VDDRPIGIFDSGVGGLTVVARVRKTLPSERIVYFGDTARVPYGTKSPGVVRRYAQQDAAFLAGFNPKLVVIACHTVSALAADLLRKKFTSVQFLDVIGPSVARAVAATRSGRIGVIGTAATISSGQYQKALKKADPAVRVATAVCSLFVPLAEEGWVSGRFVEEVADRYLRPMRAARIDTLILGCTHYPLLKRAIRRAAGGQVVLVDAAEEIAREARRFVQAGRMASSRPAAPPVLYFSDCAGTRGAVIRRFLRGGGCRLRRVSPAFLEEACDV